MGKASTETAFNRASTYSLEKALEYLNKDFPTRTLSEDLKEIIGTGDEGAKREKILRDAFGDVNVDNWLFKNSISRDNAFKVCIVLGLDLEQSEKFITKTCAESWVHLRDYKDIIYYFFIQNGKSSNVQELIIDDIPIVGQKNKVEALIAKYSGLDVENRIISDEDARKKALNVSVFPEERDGYTQKYKRKVIEINSIESLTVFLNNVVNRRCFGTFNNTAYKYFKQNLDYLNINYMDSEFSIAGEQSADKKINISEITADFRMGIPMGKKRSNYSELQWEFKKNVPSRTVLNEYYIGEKSVSRKALIISLLLVNESEDFYEAINTINFVLYRCGMPMLNSKNQYDWAVINSLKDDGTENGNALEYMENIVGKIFEGGI